ncbi:hypothetical protein AAHE18_19G192400 [Arachis hypogaea]
MLLTFLQFVELSECCCAFSTSKLTPPPTSATAMKLTPNPMPALSPPERPRPQLGKLGIPHSPLLSVKLRAPKTISTLHCVILNINHPFIIT